MKSLAMIILILLLCVSIAHAEEKVVDAKFIGVSVYVVLMTIFDVETTFAGIRNGAHEANPIMRPFTNKGRVATYAVQLAIDAAVLAVAYKMKESDNKTLKRTWFVLPGFVGTTHGVCGGLNLRYVF